MKKLPILIVDDDEGIRTALNELLRDEYECLLAENGQKALEWLKAGPVAVVLLDILLPDSNGKILLQAIKPNWPLTEVIMVTGTEDVPTILDSLDQGAYDYLTKPWDVADLRATLRRAAEKWSLATLLCLTQADQAGLGNPSPRTLAAKFLKSINTPYSPAVKSRIEKSVKAGAALPYHQIIENVERKIILRALRSADYNRTLAAQHLGLHRNSLNQRIRALDVRVRGWRDRFGPDAPPEPESES